MRNYCSQLSRKIEDDVFKEVVIIGNGPSGIVLSYILSGNWPYYNGEPHPDEMLTARLNSINTDNSLLQEDMKFLCFGLEGGRSPNPVSSLIDQLMHPNEDQYFNSSSGPLLKWKYDPDKKIDHVVIGKGKPGGVWQAMNGNILTISLNSWMELPEMSFKEWKILKSEHDNEETCTCGKKQNISLHRVKAKHVAEYYSDYVDHMKLDGNLRNFSYVTTVTHIKNIDEISRDLIEKFSLKENDALWSVEGYDKIENSNFRYITKAVVLAVGVSDVHKVLGIPEELSHPDWIFHNLRRFQIAIEELSNIADRRQLDPILVVGSGLTAADAVLVADRGNFRIIHVFTTSNILNESRYPKSTYPEYNRVYRLMSGDIEAENYRPLSQHRIIDLSTQKGRRVRIMTPDGKRVWHKVSLVAVAIGYQADLNFLSDEFDNGRTLGVQKNHQIDSRKNPIAICPWTHKVKNAPDGLYALGPLVGDTLVRVIPGGAVAIASNLTECCPNR